MALAVGIRLPIFGLTPRLRILKKLLPSLFDPKYIVLFLALEIPSSGILQGIREERVNRERPSNTVDAAPLSRTENETPDTSKGISNKSWGFVDTYQPGQEIFRSTVGMADHLIAYHK